jgi:hypothetical protein
MDSFPEECRNVLETLASAYKNDRIAKERNLNAHERLRFHQALRKSKRYGTGSGKWTTRDRYFRSISSLLIRKVDWTSPKRLDKII